MNAGGWIMLTVSWAAILWVVVFALHRTLKARTDELAVPLDIEREIEAEQNARESEEDATE